jgi:copper chaperone CopZ
LNIYSTIIVLTVEDVLNRKAKHKGGAGMKRAFKLEGLNCANCAEKIEREVKALRGVNFASVNFMTAKMVIDGDDVMFDEIVKAAQGIVARYEPDVVVKKA